MQIPGVREVPATPFESQRPGTSGLRKKTRVFMQPGYVENFVQSVFDALHEAEPGGFAGETLVVGGDGRYYNQAAAQTIIRLAAANGFGSVLVGRDGILSTPAMSAVIRRRRALGGLLLTASHNPGGIDEDFGIKFNTGNGGPAPEALTERIYAHTRSITRYLVADAPDLPLGQEQAHRVGSCDVQVIDPLADYTALMEEIFDFDALRACFARGLKVVVDGMHGVTGPYARYILEDRLGAAAGTVINGTPREDFGGEHPDPNLVHAAGLVALMAQQGGPDFGAACDGDGDRNLILGRNFFVSPGDSLAIVAEHAGRIIPRYRSGVAGIARSMPTSTAADRVARALGIPCYETPTGWKFFGNLMDAGLCTFCGEESFGTGSNHIREKDGLWAVLCWISILAATGRSVADVVRDHWARFGRSYYQRHDYEGLEAEPAAEMFRGLVGKLPTLAGARLGTSAVASAGEFTYRDPVDGSVSEHQGIRVLLEDGSRAIFRLSGTGTEGATLRIYLESFRQDFSEPVERVLAPLVQDARALIELERFCKRAEPSVIT